MFGLSGSKLQPIGIDIGHDAIRMVQVEARGASLAVRAAARESLPAEVRTQPQLRIPLAVDLARRMLRSGGFAGRRAVAALPRELVHIKSLRLPAMPPEELESAVMFEARQLFSFDTDDAMVRMIPAGEVRQNNDVVQEVLVLAARNEDVNNFVEQLHRCGVVLESLDVEPCALFRSIERFIRRRADELEVHVLVDVGYAGSQIIIGKGRDISFLKTIEIGAQHLNDAVARKLGITPDEAQALRRRQADAGETGESGGKSDPVRQAVFDALRGTLEQLGREISLCLRYQSVTFRGHRPTRLRLLGGEANDPRVVEALKSAIPVPVEAARPLYSVDCALMKPQDRRGAGSDWALALGLALRQTSQRFAPRDGRPRGVVPPEAPADDATEPGEQPADEAAIREEALHA